MPKSKELTGGDAFSRLIGKRKSSTQTDDANDQRKRATQAESASDNRTQTAQTDSADHKQQPQAQTEGGDVLRVQAAKGPTFEEAHTRATYWMPNELLADLDAFSRRSGLSKSQVVARATRYFIENATIDE